MRITKESMEKLDKRAVEEFGIDSILLMENAAMAVFEKIKNFNSYTVICGSGNNGGDALALSRHLILNDKGVEVFIVKDVKTPDAKKNLEILKRMTLNIHYIDEDEDLDQLIKSLMDKEVVVDGIFGIGLDREVSGIAKKVIEKINEFGKFKVSIDVPSGIETDTGEVLGVAVIADKTIAIHTEKPCHENWEICGEVVAVYIGIPRENQLIINS